MWGELGHRLKLGARLKQRAGSYAAQPPQRKLHCLASSSWPNLRHGEVQPDADVTKHQAWGVGSSRFTVTVRRCPLAQQAGQLPESWPCAVR